MLLKKSKKGSKGSKVLMLRLVIRCSFLELNPEVFFVKPANGHKAWRLVSLETASNHLLNLFQAEMLSILSMLDGI